MQDVRNEERDGIGRPGQNFVGGRCPLECMRVLYLRLYGRVTFDPVRWLQFQETDI